MRWLVCLLAVLRGASVLQKPCEEPTEFSPPDKDRRDTGGSVLRDARVNCQCHGPGEEQVTSLLHSDENKARPSSVWVEMQPLKLGPSLGG